MRILLDTHSFLWFLVGSSNLSSPARRLIESPDNEKLFSIASLWEIAIKVSLGKLTLSKPFEQIFPDQLAINGIELLPVTIPHLERIAIIPFLHRDPFDRLLVAQCQIEGIPILSADASFDAYSIERLW